MAVTKELAPRRSRIMSKLITLLLLAGLAVGGLYVYQTHFAKAATTQPTTTNAIVTRGNIFQAVATTGRVVSNLDVEIKCKAAGQIIELPYDVSQEVKLLQSQAKLAQSKHSLTIAEQTLANNRDKIASLLKSTQSAAKDAQDKA